MRGYSVLLVDRGDFCSMTSGGNHGVLHSGARYVVSDPHSASECARENSILRRVAAPCIEPCGGLFVALRAEDMEYSGRFEDACRRAAVPAAKLSPREAKEKEPQLADALSAYAVEDASVDPFHLTFMNVEAARQAGAEAVNYTELTRMEVQDGAVRAAWLRSRRLEAEERVAPELVINCAGAGAGAVARMASLHLDIGLDAGAMAVANGRLVNGLVNRLRPPSDGDIVVPNATSMILGTTSRRIPSPEPPQPTREEVALLIREASAMVPGLRGSRIIRAYSGIRPLAGATGRSAGRGASVVDHAAQGVDNLISVFGGKLTTYRAMAEEASDIAGRKLGRKASCRTHVLEMPSARPRIGGPEICTCEHVTAAEVRAAVAGGDCLALGDVLRRTRLGMGYCQGLECSLSAAEAMGGDMHAILREFERQRWRGVEPVMEGDQLRQEYFRRCCTRSLGVGGIR
jgi:glycerol-3-phosphate dehydrogenase